MGSATTQGILWGKQPRDWAEFQEPLCGPLYQVTLQALEPLGGLKLLDAGCGSGLLLQMAAQREAAASGVDASAPLTVVARQRVPGADLRVGDLESLPFDDSSFDIVTAFNALQYAENPKRAAMELARVAVPGGRIAIGLWGDPKLCETEALFAALRQLAPPPPGTPAPLNLSAPGMIESVLTEAGLRVEGGRDVQCPFEYRDMETAWRALAASGPLVKTIGAAGEGAVRETFDRVMMPSRRSDGSVRQINVFRYVLARVSA